MLAVRHIPTLSDFNQLIWWLVLLKVAIVFVFLLLTTIFMIWFERRVIGRMQNRPGPNRAGPFGLLQPIADALKLPLKEDIVPTAADKLVFFVAPVLSAATAFVAFAIIPWGPEVSIFHHQTPLQVADLPVAVLLVLAMSSIGVYGIVLAGWASALAVLAARRAALGRPGDQLRDRDGAAFVAVFLYAGSLSTTAIVTAQQHDWYVWVLSRLVPHLPGHDGRRDQPAARSTCPRARASSSPGYHTEYSSMKFAMFFLAEYINMTTVSALATTLFLGGWRAPVAALAVVRREQRLVAGALVPDQGLPPAVRLRLAARHAAPDPLRPAHGARLEDPHPGLDRLAPAGRHRAARCAARHLDTHRRLRRAPASSSCSLIALVMFWDNGRPAARPMRRTARRGRGRGRVGLRRPGRAGKLAGQPERRRGSRCRRSTCRTTTA